MRRILTLLLAVLTLAALAVPAAAANHTDLVIRMKDGYTPIPGMQFEIYRVGEEQEGTLVLTGPFADYPVNPNTAGEDSSAEAAALYGYAQKDELTPNAVVQTNAQGRATVKNLESGLYLIGGKPLVYGGYVYRTEPQLVLLPRKDPVTGQILENTVLDMKFSKEPHMVQPVSLSVRKVWQDHPGNVRPESLTVHLLKNGQVFDTVVLNAENRWQYTWENLDASALWQITEVVPQGYTVTVEQVETVFLLTNTAQEVPPTEPPVPSQTSPPSGTNIPQTGTLWGPIAALAAAGVLMLSAGRVFRKRLLMLLSLVLLAAAGFMTADGLRKQTVAEEASRELMTRLEVPVRGTEPVPEVLQLADWERDTRMEMPEILLDGTAYIGTVEIPALDLNLPVAGTTTRENLQKAPCRYSGSAYTGNLVLGAHNYDAHFGRLKQLSYGETVSVTDMDGNVFSYQVADIEILQPDQLEDLLGDGWPLTLYTCTPGGQSRVVIRCESV